jgi:glycosyltransferase involved in cell wall biosynthesis
MASQLISVIIPTFNRTKFLRETIDCVLNQTYSNVEILLINDGSENSYTSEIKKIANTSNKICLYNLPIHKGVAVARNLGLEKAKGEYLYFLDDDDLIPNNLFEIAVNQLSNQVNLSGIIFIHKYLIMADYLGIIPVPMLDYREMQSEIENKPFSVILSCCPPIHSFFLRMDVIGNERFLSDVIIGEDWYFWLKLAHKGCSFRLSKNAVICYRKHLESSTLDQERFFRESMNILFKVAENKMLRNREEKFLLKAKAFAFCLRAKKIVALKYLLQSLLYPEFAIKYLYRSMSYYGFNLSKEQ